MILVDAQATAAGLKVILTPEEATELAERPVAGTRLDFTPAQLKVRRDIGRKIWEAIPMETTNPMVLATYAATPPWKFYVEEIPPGRGLRRVYGALELEGDTHPRAHCVTFRFWEVFDLLDGVLCSDLTAVEEWTKEDKEKFLVGEHGGVYLDPLGYLSVIRNMQR